MLRIIDNKRIELTDSEFELYKEICNSLSRENFDGKDLFKNLFETDENGMITFLRPPTTQFSMEVIIFLQNVMVHQHLRKIYAEHDEAMKELNRALDEIKNQLK